MSKLTKATMNEEARAFCQTYRVGESLLKTPLEPDLKTKLQHAPSAKVGTSPFILMKGSSIVCGT
ncbi:MAG: hypothetical protein ACRCYY_10340 [Trueperaceae bacterium]